MSLGGKSEQFVAGKVESGDQQTAPEALRDDLRLLEKEELLKQISVLMMSELEAKLPETAEALDKGVKNPNAFKRLWKSAFTLIELAISLVIIGLIIGAIEVGQDLIKAAEIRAQVGQIEKYNTADNTFRLKYGFHPGDIPDPAASAFGFVARGAQPGGGDGNGIIQGSQCGGSPNGIYEDMGESPTVFVDLSAANLIDGTFNTASPSSSLAANLTGASVGLYFPAAKIGQGNYVYVWSGGPGIGAAGAQNGINYWGLGAVPAITSCGNGGIITASVTQQMSVAQAYAIDAKMDDGMPGTGKVEAMGLWGNGSVWAGDYNCCSPTIANHGASSTSCYDNSRGAGIRQQYSTAQNSGTGMNCFLSFQFQ